MGTVEKKQGPDFRPIFPHSELLLKVKLSLTRHLFRLLSAILFQFYNEWDIKKRFLKDSCLISNKCHNLKFA